MADSIVLPVCRGVPGMDVVAPQVRLFDELDSVAGSGYSAGVASDHQRLVRGPFHGRALSPGCGRGVGAVGDPVGTGAAIDRTCGVTQE
jgi:hypothetical protein